MNSQDQWVGIDWGTSNVRAWLLTGDDTSVANVQSDQGMSSLQPDDYPNILAHLLSELQAPQQARHDIWISGMAGARQGWKEAPYLAVPCALAELGIGSVSPENPPDGTRCRIVPGICQTGTSEDVMRGEETQLLGLLKLKPGFEGIVCMPGTHCKWVEIKAGAVVRFATVMTGELYSVLAGQSVLRHSLGGDREGPDLEAGVAEGLSVGINAPERLTANLFRTRAASLLSGRGSDWCSGYLSGLLVGSEVAAHRDWISTTPVALLGSERLVRLYSSALERLDARGEAIDATRATIAGLSAARENFHNG